MNDTTGQHQLKSQTAAILAHLQKHGTITHDQARELYGCYALRSRISDLRKSHQIGDKWVKFNSRFGNPGKVKMYTYKQQAA